MEDTVRYTILKKYLRYDTDTRYRYFYRVSVSICCIHLIGSSFVLIAFPVKFNKTFSSWMSMGKDLFLIYQIELDKLFCSSISELAIMEKAQSSSR